MLPNASSHPTADQRIVKLCKVEARSAMLYTLQGPRCNAAQCLEVADTSSITHTGHPTDARVTVTMYLHAYIYCFVHENTERRISSPTAATRGKDWQGVHADAKSQSQRANRQLPQCTHHPSHRCTITSSIIQPAPFVRAAPRMSTKACLDPRKLGMWYGDSKRKPEHEVIAPSRYLT